MCKQVRHGHGPCHPCALVAHRIAGEAVSFPRILDEKLLGTASSAKLALGMAVLVGMWLRNKHCSRSESLTERRAEERDRHATAGGVQQQKGTEEQRNKQTAEQQNHRTTEPPPAQGPVGPRR